MVPLLSTAASVVSPGPNATEVTFPMAGMVMVAVIVLVAVFHR
jgi:hypothetical protein